MFAVTLSAVLLTLAAVLGDRVPPKPVSLSNAMLGRLDVPSIEWTLENLEVLNVTQRVDHFNPQNHDTFLQRYIVRDEFYQANGPIIVLVGDHSYLNPYIVEDTLAMDIINETKGVLFALEHRYFGNSYPVANLSTANLRYLTVDQALADIAHFIAHIKRETAALSNATVIVVGKKYGGSLAVWFRQQYPHLATGAWASSAPVYAKQNHYEFKENAGATLLRFAGAECYDQVERGFAQLERLAREQRLDELSELLQVCEKSPIVNQNDVSELFIVLSEMFSTISTIRPYVPLVCDMVLNTTHPSPAAAVAAVVREFQGPNCLHIDYDGFIATESDIELDSIAAMAGVRATMYQMCTQLGWWPTSDSEFQPFGSMYPLAFFEEICLTLFGVSARESLAGSARLNVEHGGLRPEVRNVLFTSGEDDPSRMMSVLEDLNEYASAVTIPDAGSAYDFYTLEYYDTPALNQIKNNIITIVKSWLY